MHEVFQEFINKLTEQLIFDYPDQPHNSNPIPWLSDLFADWLIMQSGRIAELSCDAICVDSCNLGGLMAPLQIGIHVIDRYMNQVSSFLGDKPVGSEL